MSACIFCRIVERALPAAIFYEDDHAVAFEDVNPQAPVHALVIPKRHVASVEELAGDGALSAHLLKVCVKVAQTKGVSTSGYRIVTNVGAHGGQTVFHLHFHVLGGRPMTWPPG